MKNHNDKKMKWNCNVRQAGSVISDCLVGRVGNGREWSEVFYEKKRNGKRRFIV